MDQSRWNERAKKQFWIICVAFEGHQTLLFIWTVIPLWWFQNKSYQCWQLNKLINKRNNDNSFLHQLYPNLKLKWRSINPHYYLLRLLFLSRINLEADGKVYFGITTLLIIEEDIHLIRFIQGRTIEIKTRVSIIAILRVCINRKWSLQPSSIFLGSIGNV